MKRKNLVAMGLAGVMAVGMCMPVMAADDAKISPDSTTGILADNSSETTVTVEQVEAFTVTIPASTTYESTDKTNTFDLKIEAGYVLTPGNVVKIKANTPESLVVQDSQVTPNKLAVELYKKVADSNEVKLTNASNEAAVFAADAGDAANTAKAQSMVLKVPANTVIKHAGTYTGEVTFVVSCEAATQN